MRRSIYEENYSLLVQLGIIYKGKAFKYGRSRSGDYIDLIVTQNDWPLPQQKDGYTLSMAHKYNTEYGDIKSDPELILAVYPKVHEVEVLTFEITGIKNSVVYPFPNKVNRRIKKDSNEFLKTWLNNLITQGFGIEWLDEEGENFD